MRGKKLKILVFSDTHGKTELAISIAQRIDNIDLVLHLGDTYRDAQIIKEKIKLPLIAVKGNMDGYFGNEGHHILETDYGKIFLAHGHMENVKNNYDTICYKAESMGCKAAIFGHTHIPLSANINGFCIINPGSLALPIGGRMGSYAIVNIDENEMNTEIFYENSKIDIKSEPGTLKNILNNSDRF